MKPNLKEVVFNRGIRALAPIISFVGDSCYWPNEIGLTEKFNPKWVIDILNESADVFLGLSYKGKDYLFPLDGGYWITVDANSRLTITGNDFTIEKLFENIETITETQTLEITFNTGYVTGAEGNYVFNVTDTLSAPTYVKVGGGLPVPTWMLAAGVGLGVILVGGVALSRQGRK